jgi:ectoine hydroxylase-related dioxygenase (phytanoyl-CoA dioxygenase family)
MTDAALPDVIRRARNNLARFGGSQSRDEAALQRTLENIDKYGLRESLLELELTGYTILKGVLSAEKIDRARSAVLRRVERKTGRKIDLATACAEDFQGMLYQPYLLWMDSVFPEILLEPRPLALISYLLGEGCVFSSMGSHVRGPGGMPLVLHADSPGPAPFSPIATVANCNYVLTPYNKEAGALMLFPGSHRLCRQPLPHENWMVGYKTMMEVAGENLSSEQIDALEWTSPKGGVTMELDPGDAVVWHGNSWHAGWRRELPGMRMNLAVFFSRPHLAPVERRGETRYPEVFERYANQPRFAQLLGANLYYGWGEEGPDDSKRRLMPVGLYD